MRIFASTFGAALGLLIAAINGPLYQIPTGIFDNPLLLQIPLAGIVVIVVALFLYFVDRWLKAEREARAGEARAEREARALEASNNRIYIAEQMKAEREQRESETTRLRDFMASQNRNFLEGLKEQRESFNSIILIYTNELKVEMKEASTQLINVTALLNAHDVRSQEARRRGDFPQ